MIPEDHPTIHGILCMITEDHPAVRGVLCMIPEGHPAKHVLLTIRTRVLAREAVAMSRLLQSGSTTRGLLRPKIRRSTGRGHTPNLLQVAGHAAEVLKVCRASHHAEKGLFLLAGKVDLSMMWSVLATTI